MSVGNIGEERNGNIWNLTFRNRNRTLTNCTCPQQNATAVIVFSDSDDAKAALINACDEANEIEPNIQNETEDALNQEKPNHEPFYEQIGLSGIIIFAIVTTFVVFIIEILCISYYV